MPDGFPIQSNDVDFQIQGLISRDLENAPALWAAFNEKHPGNPEPASLGYFVRQQKAPSSADLYPRAAEGALQEWLAPMLRRLRWQNAQGKKAMSFQIDLTWMVNEQIREIRAVSEEQFVALGEHADCFAGASASQYLQRMLHFTKALEKPAPLGGRAAEALGAVLEFARQLYKSATFWEYFVWPYFRSTALVASGDGCWDAGVRRDIESMKPPRRKLWLRVFDGKDKHTGGACEPSGSAMAALKGLPKEELEADLRRWNGLLKDVPEARLSPAGTVVFRYVLALSKRLSGPALDDLLYTTACAPWRREQDARWVETFLWVLGGRPKDRAFACLEALAMNPATATDDVKKEYDAALRAFVAEARGIGIDGYRWDTEPELATHQRRIEEMLQVTAVAVTRGAYIHPLVLARMGAMKMPEAERASAMRDVMARSNARSSSYDVGPDVRSSLDAIAQGILKEFAAEPVSLHRAATNRWEWISARQKDFPSDLVKGWQQCFWGFAGNRGLAQKSLSEVRTVPPLDLVRTIQTSPGSWKILDLCQQHVTQHGWSAELVEAFREWIRTLDTASSEREFRAKAEWFVWFEDVLHINLEMCWGERVRRDLREMKAEERQAWRALFGEGVITITNKPTKKWLKPAEAAFPKVGAAAFRKRFKEWFEPFGASAPLRLTVAGRNVLRLLMWSALIAKDPTVDKALAGFASAQWKTKENQRCASQAEMAFTYVMAERAPEKALVILEEMVRSKRACPGSASYKTYQMLCARRLANGGLAERS